MLLKRFKGQWSRELSLHGGAVDFPSVLRDGSRRVEKNGLHGINRPRGELISNKIAGEEMANLHSLTCS